jgi:hypothetical protein
LVIVAFPSEDEFRLQNRKGRGATKDLFTESGKSYRWLHPSFSAQDLLAIQIPTNESPIRWEWGFRSSLV